MHKFSWLDLKFLLVLRRSNKNCGIISINDKLVGGKAMTKAKILTVLLQNEGYISGETLSELCQVSRAAIWKQIKRLQQEGYDIQSQHGLGYRLIGRADALNPQQIKCNLKPGIFLTADAIHYLDSIDSTNSEAKRLALAGAREGTVVLAEVQTAGKGRLGRSWTSSGQKGIWCSVLLTPPVNIAQVGQYSFVAAVAVAEGIAAATGLPVEIKWPNDVLINRKKVCGVLLELVAELEQVDTLIVGFGVNVNQELADFPEEVQHKATSLAILSGKRVNRVEVLSKILNALQENYQLMEQEGFEPIRQKWLQRCCLLGQEVVISGNGRQIMEGILAGLRADGALLLETAEGQQAILSGDVSLRSPGSQYV